MSKDREHFRSLVMTLAPIGVIFTIAPSFAVAADTHRKAARCNISVNVDAVRTLVDSIDFSWAIPTSCDSGGVVAVLDSKFGICAGPDRFDYKSAKPVFESGESDGDSYEGSFTSISGPFITTLPDLLPGTRYCFGFMLKNESGSTFGPFIGSASTRPDTPTTIKSKSNFTPEIELRYHVGNLDLDIVQVSTANPLIQQYLELVHQKFSAKLISNLYTTDRCGYPLDPSATVLMRYDTERLAQMGVNPLQLSIFESEPTDVISVKLPNQHLDLANHLITATVSVLNCPNFVPVGVKALPSNFGIFVSTAPRGK